MYPSRKPLALSQFFSGLTEYAFQTRLGVADPPLVEYVAGVLTRFVHCDAIYKIRDPEGRRLEEVAEMLLEAEGRVGDQRREVHRHIGDYTLFWAGVYPEALERKQRLPCKDGLLDYCAQGKRAYYIASTLPGDDDAENALLERLSHDFELCVYGLNEVRREWSRRDTDGEPEPPILFN